MPGPAIAPPTGSPDTTRTRVMGTRCHPLSRLPAGDRSNAGAPDPSRASACAQAPQRARDHQAGDQVIQRLDLQHLKAAEALVEQLAQRGLGEELAVIHIEHVAELDRDGFEALAAVRSRHQHVACGRPGRFAQRAGRARRDAREPRSASPCRRRRPREECARRRSGRRVRRCLARPRRTPRPRPARSSRTRARRTRGCSHRVHSRGRAPAVRCARPAKSRAPGPLATSDPCSGTTCAYRAAHAACEWRDARSPADSDHDLATARADR